MNYKNYVANTYPRREIDNEAVANLAKSSREQINDGLQFFLLNAIFLSLKVDI